MASEEEALDKAYTGIRLPAEGVNLRYLVEMIKVFNNDKMIHYR